MWNYKWKGVLPIIAVIMLAGCRKNSGTNEEQLNFIVQEVQVLSKDSSLEGQTDSASGEDMSKSAEKEGKENVLSREPYGAESLKEEEVLQQYAISAASEDGASEGDVADMEEELDTLLTPAKVRQMPAHSVVDLQELKEDEINACFSFEEVSEEIFGRMEGNSFRESCTISLASLRYVRVLHYGFDDRVYTGELVVNESIAVDVVEIFKELFEAKYPIEKMLLVDEYGGDDNASMEDNNSSSFNFRIVEGVGSLSKHAYGLAIDINPRYNPYIPELEGVEEVLPANAAEYVDRTRDCAYYIRNGDLCYEAFARRGFLWGGDWAYGKDYQHFFKTAE